MNLIEFFFGTHLNRTFTQVAKATGAKWVATNKEKNGAIVLKYKVWTIVLDIYEIKGEESSIKYTRIRVPYLNKDGFQFKIYRKSQFSGIGKFFGMEDFEIGYDDFDEDFIIQGNDHFKLLKLLDNVHIRKLMQKQARIKLEVLDNDPRFLFWKKKEAFRDVDRLEFKVLGVINDTALLIYLFQLFTNTLDQLCEIGAADEVDPKVDILATLR